jgi:hypothetical protein
MGRRVMLDTDCGVRDDSMTQVGLGIVDKVLAYNVGAC